METNSTLDNLEKIKKVYFSKPPLLLRIKSIFIDMIVVILVMMIALKVLTICSIESGTIRGIVLALILLYEPIFTSLNRTLGQKMMGLRVRSFSTLKNSKESKNINIVWSMLRFLIKSILGWLSLLTIHSNTYGKAIHDSIANSVMTLEK